MKATEAREQSYASFVKSVDKCIGLYIKHARTNMKIYTENVDKEFIPAIVKHLTEDGYKVAVGENILLVSW